jgi:uncharacterized protein (TIGR03435 family)
MLPDGTFRLMNSPLRSLVSAAYPGIADYVDPPEWLNSERYDVIAKSALTEAAPEDRSAMMRALLADRFGFVAHVEKRDSPTFNLVLARSDGRLGPGITRTQADCATEGGRKAAAALSPPAGSLVPVCSWRMMDGGFEGDVTLADLASILRTFADRHVFDNTGLSGHHRVKLAANLFAPELSATGIDSPTTIFTALQEQLGLKLEPSRAPLDVLVIDRMERPRENGPLLVPAMSRRRTDRSRP